MSASARRLIVAFLLGAGVGLISDAPLWQQIALFAVIVCGNAWVSLADYREGKADARPPRHVAAWPLFLAEGDPR